jgi:hypothetical protein
MYNLPSYLESLANIIFQLDDVSFVSYHSNKLQWGIVGGMVAKVLLNYLQNNRAIRQLFKN